MLLETLESTPSIVPSFTSAPEKSSAGGTVILMADGIPPRVLLAGSGDGWSTQGTTLFLQPSQGQMLPVWYQFTIAIATTQGYTLIGAQIYSDPGNSNATTFYPAGSDGTVSLNLLNALVSGSPSVSYLLGVGLRASNGTEYWIGDPTITFSPQT